MLSSLLDFGLSIFSGGVTGLLGTAVSGVIDYFQGRQQHRNELELRRLDIELAKAEASGAANVAAVQAESARDQAEWDAMRASYRDAGQRMSRPGDGFLMKLVDFVRGITRPALTWALVGAAVAIYFTLVDDLMRDTIIDTVLYLATAAVLWWFGQRQIEKRRA